MLQAQLGYMDLTGQADGPPTLMGVPMVDLKAGDEVFAQTMLALAEMAEGKKGARIDISMARAAASWLQTTFPLLDLGASALDIRRSGNEHREFVPVNVYQTADSWLYLAIGNDGQWTRLTELKQHLTHTVLPGGREVRLPPTAVETARKEMSLAPKYGEHTRAVLGAAGLDWAEIDDLQKRGIIH